MSKPAGRTAQAGQGPSAAQERDAGGDDRSDTTHQPTEVSKLINLSRDSGICLLSGWIVLQAHVGRYHSPAHTGHLNFGVMTACWMLESQLLRGRHCSNTAHQS